MKLSPCLQHPPPAAGANIDGRDDFRPLGRLEA